MGESPVSFVNEACKPVLCEFEPVGSRVPGITRYIKKRIQAFAGMANGKLASDREKINSSV